MGRQVCDLSPTLRQRRHFYTRRWGGEPSSVRFPRRPSCVRSFRTHSQSLTHTLLSLPPSPTPKVCLPLLPALGASPPEEGHRGSRFGPEAIKPPGRGGRGHVVVTGFGREGRRRLVGWWGLRVEVQVSVRHGGDDSCGPVADKGPAPPAPPPTPTPPRRPRRV